MRAEFHKVGGQVHYGNLGSKQADQFRHQIAMNTEGMPFLPITGSQTVLIPDR